MARIQTWQLQYKPTKEVRAIGPYPICKTVLNKIPNTADKKHYSIIPYFGK